MYIQTLLKTPSGSLDSAWQNSEVAKRTGDFGNYFKDRCFRKFLLKADYLMPCIIAEQQNDLTERSRVMVNSLYTRNVL